MVGEEDQFVEGVHPYELGLLKFSVTVGWFIVVYVVLKSGFCGFVFKI